MDARKIDRMFRNLDQPIVIPEKYTKYKVAPPPEFVNNTLGMHPASEEYGLLLILSCPRRRRPTPPPLCAFFLSPPPLLTIVGSANAATSQEFHVYRSLRRKEHTRQQMLDLQAREVGALWWWYRLT